VTKSEQPPATDPQIWVCQRCRKENRGNRQFCWSCEAAKDSTAEDLGKPEGSAQSPPVEPFPGEQSDTPARQEEPSLPDLAAADRTGRKRAVWQAPVAGVLGAIGIAIAGCGMCSMLGDSSASALVCTIPVGLVCLLIAWGIWSAEP
jgi:hypothetical protein